MTESWRSGCTLYSQLCRGCNALVPGAGATNDVEVQVVNFLTAVGAAVGNNAEPAIGAGATAVVGRNLWNKRHHATQPAGVGFGDVLHGRDMMFWNDQQMNRRCGVDVVKNQNFVVFEDLAGRNFTADDFTEQALSHEQPERDATIESGYEKRLSELNYKCIRRGKASIARECHEAPMLQGRGFIR